LAHAPFASASKSLSGLLDPQVPQAVQLAAAEALGQHDDPRVGEILLQSWRGYSPKVRGAALDVLVSRADRAVGLLEAVKSGRIKSAEIDRDKQQLLLNHPAANVRSSARTILGEATGNRGQVVAQYEKALELDGDATRGREVFTARCATCHKVGDVGHQVGPDLASTQNKSPADLLISILDPNREAQSNFTTYTVVTTDGNVLSGLIAAETAGSITLRRAEGKQDVVLRSNIETLASNGVSLMPEGVEKEISPEQMADLLAFVKTLKAEGK
jgi:putative heme-binding domain-containing protein